MTKTTVVNIKLSKADVYIGRPSIWGSRFTHITPTAAMLKQTPDLQHVSTRAVAVQFYAEWIKTQPQLLARLHELKGRNLGCHCKPLSCHGDVLAAMADALPE